MTVTKRTKLDQDDYLQESIPTPVNTVNFTPLDAETRDDRDEVPDTEFVSTGDVIGAKTTIEVEVNGHKTWHTYEFRTRVMDGETENNSFGRVATIVNSRVLDMAYDLDERISEVTGRNQRSSIR